ncbi:MAG: hypothetical protein ACAI35_13355 [Candidatus Methylacidiphilales bacterium]|nr:hypothetical protein [Candidatus Methylacidiphilales bacterium]
MEHHKQQPVGKPRASGDHRLGVVSIALALLLMAYPLSVGPLTCYYRQLVLGVDAKQSAVVYCVYKGPLESGMLISDSTVMWFYRPLYNAYTNLSFVKLCMNGYLKLWGVDMIAGPLWSKSAGTHPAVTLPDTNSLSLSDIYPGASGAAASRLTSATLPVNAP